MLKKRKFWVAGVVLAIAMGALVYNSVAGASVYYYSVKELTGQANSLSRQEVRINGLVAPLPIQWDARSRTTTFTIKDKETDDAIAVVYRGTVPDAFKVDTDVVLRGKLNAQGVFEANELQARCASKYTPKI